MKKLFLFLLNRYSNTEKERIQIIKVLNDKVSDNYREQTTFGNVYNSNIEFVMANEFIKMLAKEKEKNIDFLRMIQNGLSESYWEAIEYIEDEM